MNQKQQKLLFLTAVLLVILLTAAIATAAPARPACSDSPKAGTAFLSPEGTNNALTLIEFAQPFCPGAAVVVTATISNQSTAGERVAAQALGLESAAVSMQLDEASDVDYVVNWMAMKATQ